MRTVGLLLLALLIFPAFAHAALININTANAELLDTLPGVGPATAASIIANRPYTSIEDISRADGIGDPGSSSYEKIKDLITVGDAAPVASSTPDTASSTPTTTGGGGSPTHIPPPSALIVNAGHDVTALLEVPLRFSAQVKTKSGTAYTSARIIWNFGDGSSMEGTAVEKTYRYAGTYLVTATVTDGSVTDSDDLIVRVVPAQVHIIVIVGQGITIANDSNKRLDLSDWRLSVDFSSFRIPPGTQILPESSVLFPYEITRLPMSRDVTLWYPNGIVAARYLPAPVSDVQPTATSSGSSVVQTVRLGEAPARQVESVVSRTINAPAREMSQIAAPSATTQLAALGAALPDLAEQSPAEPTKSSTPALLRSPWTLGLIGVMLLAGAAFIFL